MEAGGFQFLAGDNHSLASSSPFFPQDYTRQKCIPDRRLNIQSLMRTDAAPLATPLWRGLKVSVTNLLEKQAQQTPPE